MNITLIVAMGRNGVIGMGNTIPWMGNVPRDMLHFRTNTLGKSILMGRKTFQAIGGALPERVNIVLTRDVAWTAEGVVVANTLDQALHMIHPEEELMVIGGADIYAQLLPYAQKIELTVIDHEFPGDVFFPLFHGEHIFPIVSEDWQVDAVAHYDADGNNMYPMTFMTLIRV